jgi:hypothetical protein
MTPLVVSRGVRCGSLLEQSRAFASYAILQVMHWMFEILDDYSFKWNGHLRLRPSGELPHWLSQAQGQMQATP